MGFKKESETIKKEETEVKKEEEIVDEKEEKEEENPQFLKDEIESISTEVKEKQEELKKAGKKVKLINYIILGILLIFIVAAFAVVLTIGKDNDTLSVIVLVVAILLLIGSFVLTKIQKKKSREISEKYAKYISGLINKIVFNNEDIKELDFKLDDKDSNELLKKFNVYPNVRQTKTLNTIKGKYLESDFTAFDGAITVLETKKVMPYFLGKMYIFNLKNIDKDVKVIYQVKGKEYSYPVKKDESLITLRENEKESFLVNDNKYNEVLTNESLNILRKFKIDKKLYDLTLLISEGKLFIGINYEDSIINLPIEGGLNIENISRVKLDLEKILSLYKSIDK